MLKIKELTQEQLAELNEDFAMLNLKDRDDVIFNFEEDAKKMIRNLKLKKLIKKDRKYMKNVKNFIMQIVLQSYLKDMIGVGAKKFKRYKKYYLGGENVTNNA